MSRALIAGSGYVGGRLSELLAEEGHEVFALRRGAAPPRAGVSAVRASLLDPASLTEHRRSYDWLFFTAGPDSISEEAYRQTFVRGLENALDAFATDSARIVLVSSTAVFAQTQGETVDESSPTTPKHFSGRVLLEAEALLWARRPDAVVLRLGGIYGPGRASMLDAVRRGAATWVEGEESLVNRFHRDDCAGALAHLGRLAKPERLYLGVDNEPASRREVLSFIADVIGAPPPRPVPRPTEPRRRPATNKRCDNARLVGSGYRLRYPTYREGYRSLIETQN
jgi:nucleoside-diphosphate-sugar epimerase